MTSLAEMLGFKHLKNKHHKTFANKSPYSKKEEIKEIIDASLQPTCNIKLFKIGEEGERQQPPRVSPNSNLSTLKNSTTPLKKSSLFLNEHGSKMNNNESHHSLIGIQSNIVSNNFTPSPEKKQMLLSDHYSAMQSRSPLIKEQQ